jgi:hypothetical protein
LSLQSNGKKRLTEGKKLKDADLAESVLWLWNQLLLFGQYSLY